MFINFTAFSKTVSVQGSLSNYCWSRLWYFLHGLSNGSGYVRVKRRWLLELFEVDRSTLYRWLSEGKKVDAFHYYGSIDGILTIVLGSKFRVCSALGLDDWGGVIELPLRQCLRKDWYVFSSLIQTADLQRKSWFAAKYNLVDKAKKLLDVFEFFEQGATVSQTSLDMPTKILQPSKIRHIVDNRFALTKLSFVPIGASQKAIAESIGVCERTVRNHQWGVRRFQFCYPISKSEFWLREKLAQENWDRSGVFKSSNQYWRYGTNLYSLDFKLKSERFQRLNYQYFLFKENLRRGLEVDKKKLLVEIPSHSKVTLRDFISLTKRESKRRRAG